ncbi:sulfur carrier protein ThiS [Desulfovibrio sp.]|uniref:sulfur carrier protein ThiS n=1 Tax=Desulfovibrio sp. TaxID=885 RepID=UPI0023BB765D|nr:sulfur carrier protein ThiS [Desulfovibrio sp.]MDE7240675.1 sulfur carrier protein ThiS [Desulfovibrio sp.]
MELIINGAPEKGDFSTVLALLEARGHAPRAVVVELNGEIVPAAVFASRALADGDTVEIVQFVGGG